MLFGPGCRRKWEPAPCLSAHRLRPDALAIPSDASWIHARFYLDPIASFLHSHCGRRMRIAFGGVVTFSISGNSVAETHAALRPKWAGRRRRNLFSHGFWMSKPHGQRPSQSSNRDLQTPVPTRGIALWGFPFDVENGSVWVDFAFSF